MKSKKQFKVTLLKYFIMLGLIPIMVFGIFIYSYIMSVFQSELEKAAELNIESMSSSVNFIIENTVENLKILSVDNTIYEYSRFIRFKEFEQKKYDYSVATQLELYKYLELKRNLKDKINLVQGVNQHVFSVYYYDSNKDIIFDSRYDIPQYNLADFYDSEFLISASEASIYPYVMDVRNLLKEENGIVKEHKLMSIIYKIPQIRTNTYIIVNMDIQKLYKNITNRFAREGMDIFIYNSEGTLILGKDNDTKYLLDTVPNYASKIYRARDQWYFIIHTSTSGYIPLHYIGVINITKLFQGFRNSGWMIISSILIITIILTLCILYFGGRLYRPIDRILRLVTKKELFQNSSVKDIDEMSVIESAITRSENEVVELKELITQRLPQLRSHFLMNLIKHNSYSNDQIRNEIKELHFNVKISNAAILCFGVDIESELPLREHLLKSIEVKNNLKQDLEEELSVFMLDMDSDNFVGIINYGQRDLEKIKKTLNSLFEEYRKYNVRITVGIGDTHKNPIELYKSFNQASEAKKYTAILGQNVIFYSEIEHIKTYKLEYSSIIEKEILKNIRSGCAQEALIQYKLFIERLFSFQRPIKENEFTIQLIRLLLSILSALDELTINRDEIFCDKDIDIRNLLLNREGISLVNGLQRIIATAAEYLAAEKPTGPDSNYYIEKIKIIAEQEYAGNLSLQNIADRLNLNIAYLSRLFKSDMGINFSKYITLLRLEKSKELLKETDKTIQEISSQVGYASTSYYIKVFKEHEGITPSEYYRRVRI